MALFNPPLHKRGNKKCPICREPQSWRRLYLWSGWQWNCRRCHPLLGKDGGRLIPGLVVVVLWAGVLSLIDLWDQPLWAIISFCIGAVAVAGLLEWWLASVVLRHPAKRTVVDS